MTTPFEALAATDPEIADVIRRETVRQNTTVQLIASESNRIWRYDVVVSNYQRLAGPKQLVTLPNSSTKSPTKLFPWSKLAWTLAPLISTTWTTPR